MVGSKENYKFDLGVEGLIIIIIIIKDLYRASILLFKGAYKKKLKHLKT